MNWKQWLIGLANGVLSGLVSGSAASYVGATPKQIAAIATASLVVSVSKWIAQHPLPGTPS